MSHFPFLFLGQQLVLTPQKTIYWQQEKALLIADLHLGKVSHFRKSGLAIPATAALSDYQVLNYLLRAYDTKKLLILGDLFHSVINSEWRVFADWLDQNPNLQCILVKGNHDVLPELIYRNQRIEVHPETLAIGPFLFSHIPLENCSSSYYNLSGHVHPAVQLRGSGGQKINLPCFYFGQKQGLLPAFGNFTGKALIRPEKESRVFVVTPDQVLPVQI
jgi:uncharacterized protein